MQITESSQQPIRNEPWSMNLEDYLKEMYLQHGYDVALLAAVDFLDMWEQCSVGPEQIKYDVDGKIMTKNEYALHIVNNIKALETMAQDKNTMDMNNDTDVQEESWEDQDDQELLENLESLLRQQHDDYRALVSQMEQLEANRQFMCEQFARNVSHWAHFRFVRPKPTLDSVAIYMAAKTLHLKLIIPEYGHFRSLALKAKQIDSWTRIEDDSSQGARICNNTNLPFWEDFQFTDLNESTDLGQFTETFQ